MRISIENTWPQSGLDPEHKVKYTYEDDSWDSTISDMMEAFKGLLKAMGYAVDE